MGLFDRLITKAVKTATNAITDTIIENTVKPSVEEAVKDSLGIKETTYEIPSIYGEFPEYPSSMMSKPIETKTSKYNRLTITYKGTIKDEYISSLRDNGYQEGSKVRFDKGNTYVIVEPTGSNTKIAYHIKK